MQQSIENIDMKLKIVSDCLPRYTGMPLNEFGQYILLTNFFNYVKMFANQFDVKIYGEEKSMQAATHGKITIINIGMGTPNAALIMDLLPAISPQAVIFLGKCGGVKDNLKLGDYILPLAGIHGSSVCHEYGIDESVPSLPSFALQKAISGTLSENGFDYYTGTIYTTARRIWEHDEGFKCHLRKVSAMGVDMETATLFTVGFHNHIVNGALLLVSDLPMRPDGVKTEESDKQVTELYVSNHLKMGIKSLEEIIHDGKTLKHLKF